jgi:hypothetical protein
MPINKNLQWDRAIVNHRFIRCEKHSLSLSRDKDSAECEECAYVLAFTVKVGLQTELQTQGYVSRIGKRIGKRIGIGTDSDSHNDSDNGSDVNPSTLCAAEKYSRILAKGAVALLSALRRVKAASRISSARGHFSSSFT